jgi:hypothetical protein
MMAIQVQCQLAAGMAEPSLHRLNIHSGCKPRRGRRMPKVMRAPERFDAALVEERLTRRPRASSKVAREPRDLGDRATE